MKFSSCWRLKRVAKRIKSRCRHQSDCGYTGLPNPQARRKSSLTLTMRRWATRAARCFGGIERRAAIALAGTDDGADGDVESKDPRERKPLVNSPEDHSGPERVPSRSWSPHLALGDKAEQVATQICQVRPLADARAGCPAIIASTRRIPRSSNHRSHHSARLDFRWFADLGRSVYLSHGSVPHQRWERAAFSGGASE